MHHTFPLSPGLRSAIPLHDTCEILDNTHKQIALMLNQLLELSTAIQVYGPTKSIREMAQTILTFFSSTARQHHLQEERYIFPPLLHHQHDPQLVQIIQRLQQDHGWLEKDWQVLAPQLESIADGYNWYNLEDLQHTIEVFTVLYHEHIELEESIIYPAAKARLRPHNSPIPQPSAALTAT